MFCDCGMAKINGDGDILVELLQQGRGSKQDCKQDSTQGNLQKLNLF